MSYMEETKGALVPASGDVPAEAVAAIESADEEAIVQHILTGSGPDAFLYSFPVGGKPIVGISVDGAAEIAQLVGNIEVLPDMHVQDRGTSFFAAVRARNLSRNVTWMGSHEQKKNKTLRDGAGEVPDEHAFTVAISKATRNAVLRVVPQEVVHRICEQFLARGKVGRLEPPKAPALPAKAGSPTPRAETAPRAKAWKELGFASQQEQNELRQKVYKHLTEDLKWTQEQVQEWVRVQGAPQAAQLPKATLEEALALKGVEEERPTEPPF